MWYKNPLYIYFSWKTFYSLSEDNALCLIPTSKGRGSFPLCITMGVLSHVAISACHWTLWKCQVTAIWTTPGSSQTTVEAECIERYRCCSSGINGHGNESTHWSMTKGSLAPVVPLMNSFTKFEDNTFTVSILTCRNQIFFWWMNRHKYEHTGR